ncbi:hypothetical protein RchiOBHm_Chr2g0126381 [Rosa chinensis]|uniref:Uncharacterized protein n=1 Tax=Rosa chinensis TaxID=74649 RepID=A0A2P6RTS6_ROSCH|nr:hypothetical protein RchiOBHm_Chr2g0126381 [Rosa chinensis]
MVSFFCVHMLQTLVGLHSNKLESPELKTHIEALTEIRHYWHCVHPYSLGVPIPIVLFTGLTQGPGNKIFLRRELH